MPYIVLANKLAFQKTKANDPKVPDGPEEIVTQGQPVPDYATTFQVSALASAGLLAWANDVREVVVVEEPAQVRLPEQPVLLPSDPNGSAPTVGDLLTPVPDAPVDETVVDVPPAVEPTPTAAPLPALPKSGDSKEAWEQYATHPRIGMTLGEAEAMNKTDLVAEVKRRYNAANA